MNALDRVIRPIVEGQIRSFLHDHPEVAEAWTGKCSHKTKTQAVIDSLAKRISRDLGCAETRVRLVAALVEPTTANDVGTGSVECTTAPHAAGVECSTAPAALLPGALGRGR